MLNKLVDRGNTVIVIEHNMEVIKMADHIIDIGPEGGREGGLILCAGTPEEIAGESHSYTAKYLKDELNGWIRESETEASDSDIARVAL